MDHEKVLKGSNRDVVVETSDSEDDLDKEEKKRHCLAENWRRKFIIIYLQ